MSSAEVDVLLDRWEELREQGHDVSIDELCGSTPELRPEVESSIRALESVAWMDDDPAAEHVFFGKDRNHFSHDTVVPETSLTVDEFTDSVCSVGLLTKDDVLQFREDLSEEESADGTAHSLAQRIVSEGRLTRYQASVILEARSDPLLIDRYVILDTLGVGGMGVVFKALHKAMDRVVALKLLPVEAVDSPTKIERFQREARAAAKLSHPNIVTVHDAAEANGSHFLAMEYVNGPDLSAVLQQNGPLTIGQAVRAIHDAALGLQHAHDQGIVHRDIKPGNLLLTADSMVKVADLGLATIDSTSPLKESNQNLTEGGTILGTIAFLSPEQALESQQTDARADIYSLGATLFCLLTGRPPFTEDTAMKTLVAHRERPVPSLIDVCEDVPTELDQICQRMLAKRPEDRFQSMAEVADALESLPTIYGDSLVDPVEPLVDTDTHRVAAPHDVTVALNKSPGAESSATSQSVGGHPSALRWLVLGIAVLLAGIIIVIKTPDGEKIEIEVPDGSRISLKDKSGANITSDQALHLPKLGDEFWQQGTIDRPLPGLLPAPAQIDGIRRWQIQPRNPANRIFAMAWHPKKSLIACGIVNGPISLVDAETLKVKSYLLGHSAPEKRVSGWQSSAVMSLCWHPDGSILASAGKDGTIRLWNSAGQQGPVLRGHKGGVNSVAWSHDGKTLASAGDDHTVRLWSRDGTPGEVLQGHSDAVQCVMWSPDDSQLVSGGLDQKTQFWSADGTPLREIVDDRGSIRSLCWLGNKKLATAAGSSVRLVDLTGARPEKILDEKGLVYALAASPDGRQFLSGTQIRTARFWKDDGTQEYFEAHSASVYAATWSPDGQFVATANGNGELRVYNKTAKAIAKHAHPKDVTPRAVDVSPNGSRIVVGYDGGTIRLLSSDGTELTRIRNHTGYVWSIAWHPDGQSFATAGTDETVRVYDIGGSLRFKINGHEGSILSIAWSPDGAFLASAGVDKTLRLWESKDGTPGTVFRGHKATIRDIAWSSDSRRLVTGSEDRTARIWDLDETDHSPVEFKYYVYAVAWHPSDDLVALGTTNGFIRLRDPEKLHEHLRAVVPPNRTYIYALEWNKAGTLLASAHGDDTVRLWNSDGSPAGLLRGVGEDVVDLSWSDDGRYLATAAVDSTVRYWDMETRNQLWLTAAIHGGGSATYTPDGRLIESRGDQFEDNVAYVVENNNGQLKTLTPSAFEQLRKSSQK